MEVDQKYSEKEKKKEGSFKRGLKKKKSSVLKMSKKKGSGRLNSSRERKEAATSSIVSVNHPETSEEGVGSLWDIDEVLFHIFSFLSATDLLQASLINRKTYHIIQDPTLWKQLCFKEVQPSPASPPFVFPCRSPSSSHSPSSPPTPNPAQPMQVLLPALSLHFLETAHQGWRSNWKNVYLNELSVDRKLNTFYKKIQGHPLEKSPHLRHVLSVLFQPGYLFLISMVDEALPQHTVALGSALAHLLAAGGTAISAICAIISYQVFDTRRTRAKIHIDTSDSLRLLNSGNLSSKLITRYLHLSSQPYLRCVFGASLAQILRKDNKRSKKDIEPETGGEKQRALDDAALFIDALLATLEHVPRQLKVICQHMQDELHLAFHNAASLDKHFVRLISFYRFLLPVLVNPFKFNLLEGKVDGQLAATLPMRLVGVANALQHLSVETPATSDNYGAATLLSYEFVNTNFERMQGFFSLLTEPVKDCDDRKEPEIELSCESIIDAVGCFVQHLTKEALLEPMLSKYFSSKEVAKLITSVKKLSEELGTQSKPLSLSKGDSGNNSNNTSQSCTIS